MRYLSIALLIVLALVRPAAGQNAPVLQGPIVTPPPHYLHWNPTGETVATAQAMQWRARIDVPVTSTAFVPLTGTTCAADTTPGNPVLCRWLMTPAFIAPINVRGPHTILVTAFDGTTEGPAPLVPFSFPSGPGAVTAIGIFK